MITEKLNVEKFLLFIGSILARVSGCAKQPHQMTDEDFDYTVEWLYEYFSGHVYVDGGSMRLFLSVFRNPELEYGSSIVYPDWWTYACSDICRIVHDDNGQDALLSLQVNLLNHDYEDAVRAEDRCVTVDFIVTTTTGASHKFTIAIRKEGLTLNRKSIGNSKYFSNIYQENLVRYNAVLVEEQRKPE